MKIKLRKKTSLVIEDFSSSKTGPLAKAWRIETFTKEMDGDVVMSSMMMVNLRKQ